MYRLPYRSNAISDGDFRAAAVAGPPSPAKLARPLPATVSSAPVFFTIRRTRAALPSEKTRLPSGSMTTFEVESSASAREDVVARLPSGENAWVPLPAIVVIVWAAEGGARAKATVRVRACRMCFTARLSQDRGQGTGAEVATSIRWRSTSNSCFFLAPRENADISLR